MLFTEEKIPKYLFVKSYTILVKFLFGAFKEITRVHFHDNPSFTKSHLNCEYQTRKT